MLYVLHRVYHVNVEHLGRRPVVMDGTQVVLGHAQQDRNGVSVHRIRPNNNGIKEAGISLNVTS